jgi:ABC-type uncharacterized transport system permease subunit
MANVKWWSYLIIGAVAALSFNLLERLGVNAWLSLIIGILLSVLVGTMLRKIFPSQNG